MIQLTIPLVAVLSASGGTILGCIIRQPEINNLKGQLRALQKDNSEIKKLMIQQQDALQKLIAEQAKVKLFQIPKKKKIDDRIRGVIWEGYLYKEYVDLLCKAVHSGGNDCFSEEEKQTFELATRQVEGKTLTKEEYDVLRDYICFKYKKEIYKKRDVGILEYVKHVHV